MPGPLPKDPAIRQRRNKSTSLALLPADAAPRESPPRLPKLEGDEKWHPMARQFWKTIWASPMHVEYSRGDEPALLRLVYLVHLFWKEGKLAYAKEIRMLEREFGLTPLSRRRLEWTIANSEEAVDQHERKRIRRATVIDDTRGVLEG